MKRFYFVILMLFISTTAFTQVNFGIKAGAAFGYSGSLKQVVTQIKESNGKNNIGWHIGVFGRINTINNWFIQPEVYFSSMKTEFNDYSGGEFTSKSNRLDIPLLIGRKIIKTTRLYAGPVLSTSLNENISLKSIKKTKADDFSLAGQVGGGIDILSLTLDVRYEFGLNKSQTNFVNKYTNEKFQIEKRPNSLLISVGYKF